MTVTKFPVLKGIGEKGIFWSHTLFNMEKQESNFENVDGSLFLLQSYYKREKKK